MVYIHCTTASPTHGLYTRNNPKLLNEITLNDLGYVNIHPSWTYTAKTYHKEYDNIYDMFDWCDEHIGKIGHAWDFQVDRFLFRRGRDCTYFSLRW
jgi:hypothetical protein